MHHIQRVGQLRPAKQKERRIEKRKENTRRTQKKGERKGELQNTGGERGNTVWCEETDSGKTMEENVIGALLYGI